MKKLLTFILLMALSVPAWSAIQWRNGAGENVLVGSSASNLIGYNSYNKVVQPLDNLLSTYCSEYLAYNSSTIITVKAGSCVVSNSGGTIRMFMLDTSDTNLTTTNLDTGSSFSASTTYYVYSTSPNATTQTSTYYISTSSTAPSGQTYYRRIGSFYSDSGSKITQIANDGRAQLREKLSKTVGVTYQATTDGFVTFTGCAYSVRGQAGQIYSDSSSSPTTLFGQFGSGVDQGSGSGLTLPVKAGDYYKTTFSSTDSCTATVYFIPYY